MVLKSRIAIYGSQTATEGAVIRRGDLLQSKDFLLAVIYTSQAHTLEMATLLLLFTTMAHSSQTKMCH